MYQYPLMALNVSLLVAIGASKTALLVGEAAEALIGTIDEAALQQECGLSGGSTTHIR